MANVQIDRKPDDLCMIVSSTFAASQDEVWQMWADPRKLERWWGPPTFPATFVDHNLKPGGKVAYYMSGPAGEKFNGWWKVNSVEAPKALSFDDGFADENGNPNTDMPVCVIDVSIEPVAQGSTRMAITTKFPSAEAMQQLIEMGMDEGMAAAVGQIDDILAS